MCVGLIYDSLPVQTDQGRLEGEWLCEDEISYLGRGGGAGKRREDAMELRFTTESTLCLSVEFQTFFFFFSSLTLQSHDLQPLSSASLLYNLWTLLVELLDVRSKWHSCGVTRLNSQPCTTRGSLLNRHSCCHCDICLFVQYVARVRRDVLCVFLRRETLLHFPTTHPYGAYVIVLQPSSMSSRWTRSFLHTWTLEFLVERKVSIL